MPGTGARHREYLALKIFALPLSQPLLRQVLLWAHEDCTLGRHRFFILTAFSRRFYLPYRARQKSVNVAVYQAIARDLSSIIDRESTLQILARVRRDEGVEVHRRR